MRTRRAITPSRQLAVFAAAVLSLEAVTFAAPLGAALTPFVLVLIPAVSALGISAIFGGRSAVVRLTRRLVRVRVGTRWYLIALGIPVVEKLTVDVVGVLLGVSTPARLISALTVSALVVPLVVLLPAMLEELGWRGFGVETAVEQGHSPAWAALVVGAVFLALHVPLYLPGHLYAGLPFWPLPINLLASSVLLTWVYLRTRSVLVAGLMHAAFNATVPLTWGLDADWVWQARPVVLVLITAIVVGRVGLPWWRSPLHGAASSQGAQRDVEHPSRDVAPTVADPAVDADPQLR